MGSQQVSDFIDDKQTERSIFEHAKPFEGGLLAFLGELGQSHLPRRDEVIKAIPQASCRALCPADAAMDRAYG